MTDSVFDLPLFNIALGTAVIVAVCVAAYEFMMFAV